MMRFDSRSKIVVVIVMILLVACFVDASAQGQRRRRRVSRRITNPVIYSSPQPSPSPGATTDAQIVSEDEAGNQNIQPATQTTNSTHRRTNANQTEPDPDAMRRSVNRISSDVRALTQRMGQMEEQQRTLVNLERLSRSEQRAEALRTQLRDVLAKQDELHAREDQVSEALRPENIERATAGYGTTRPEEVREIRRHQLENEQHRIQDQLNTLEQSRVHLESAIASADAETERLRALVDASTTSTDQTGTNTGEQPVIVPAPNASPSPSPSTSPYAYPPLSF